MGTLDSCWGRAMMKMRDVISGGSLWIKGPWLSLRLVLRCQRLLSSSAICVSESDWRIWRRRSTSSSQTEQQYPANPKASHSPLLVKIFFDRLIHLFRSSSFYRGVSGLAKSKFFDGGRKKVLELCSHGRRVFPTHRVI